MWPFKKKYETKKYKTNDASVIVWWGSGHTGTISRKSYHDCCHVFGMMIWDGSERLSRYLDNNKSGLVELDDGNRVPLCNIIKIEPIVTVDIEFERTFEV